MKETAGFSSFMPLDIFQGLLLFLAVSIINFGGVIMGNERISAKKVVLYGLFSALAYIAVFLFRIPVVSFLKYEPKDVVITFAGLIYGPIATILISVVVSFIEMVTISDTGPIGLLMNVLATLAFALPVSMLYKKKRNINSAVFGLVIGIVSMTIVMILWNYIITPFYMKVSRQAVVEMLIPIFLPFNVLKGVINATLVFLLYKPLIEILRKSGFIPKTSEKFEKRGKVTIFNVVSIIILAICITAWIIWRYYQ